MKALYSFQNFPYCEPRKQIQGYGEACGGEKLVCNGEDNMICDLGKCVCFSDDKIEDTGTECRKKKPGKKGHSSAYSDKGFSVLLLVLTTTSCIMVYS